LERQLKAEREKHDEASARLKERDRQVMRLESDLRAARETGGRGGGSEVAASDALAEADALSAKLRAAERQAVSAEASLKETQRDLRAAERRVEELVAEQQARVHLTPSGASASHGGGAGADGELRKAREIAKKLQEENEDLRAELNSFDPAFFDEIEDLKYNHNEMVKLVDRYETLLQHLSSRYGFDFSPAAPARRSRA
jgi:DNA repair exonuclease SbcCD ATPase subunit